MASILQESDTKRRELLAKMEKITNSRVISYAANPNASPNMIDHNDPVFLNDLLASCGKVKKLDLIIDSPGGEPNVAEKIAIMCREYCDQFRVIVPNNAKSAATMIAIASDEIMMGYISEIGPIDPQIRVVAPNGQFSYVPAQSIIDSIGLLNDAMQQGIDPRCIIAILQKVDPPLLDIANKAIAFSKQFAAEWLSKHMLKDNPEKAKKIAAQLSDNRKWLSHGKRIGYAEAKELGLKVTLIPKDDPLWEVLWEYYSRCQIHLNSRLSQKLYETRDLTLNFGLTVARPPSPVPPQQ